MSGKSNLAKSQAEQETQTAESFLDDPLSSHEEGHVVFWVEGGIGKNIAATASIDSIRAAYPDRKIVVLCSWPEVWLHNPKIHRFFKHGQHPYFFYDYIKGRDTVVMRNEPYCSQDYFYSKKHISQIFCECNGVEFIGGKPEIYLTPTEVGESIDALNVAPKPSLLLQTHGGLPQKDKRFSPWLRSLPFNLTIQLKQKLEEKFSIIQLRGKEQDEIPGTIQVDYPLRIIMGMIKHAHKRLFIDSFAQHAAAAMGVESTVLWCGSSSNVFGYESNKNIQAKLNLSNYKDIDAIFTEFPIEAMHHQCPVENDFNKMFDADEIAATLLN